MILWCCLGCGRITGLLFDAKHNLIGSGCCRAMVKTVREPRQLELRLVG